MNDKIKHFQDNINESIQHLIDEIEWVENQWLISEDEQLYLNNLKACYLGAKSWIEKALA